MQVNTLYLLVSRAKLGGNSEQSLVAAAQAAGMRHQLLVVDDIMLDDIASMEFAGSNLLYRVSTGAKASTVESALMAYHGSNLTNIYWPKLRLGPTRRYAEMVEQMAAGLPVIPTSLVDETWLTMGDDELQAKVTQLGGFPVLYKTLGLAHGQGIQKLASLQELRAEVQKTVDHQGEALLREYLPEYRHFRVIVVDGTAVATIEYHKPADDFRTNATNAPDVSAVSVADVNPTVRSIALRSVELAASIIGGVDVLLDTKKQVAYLAEVNVPCNFSRAEGPTDVNIGQHIVEALIRKAQA
ncbi:MAG: ATP-grasp domain-containing protein [Candidatus Saccharimonadales bacterium]